MSDLVVLVFFSMALACNAAAIVLNLRAIAILRAERRKEGL